MCIHVKGKDQIKTTTDQWNNALFPFLDVGNRTIADSTRKYHTHIDIIQTVWKTQLGDYSDSSPDCDKENTNKTDQQHLHLMINILYFSNANNSFWIHAGAHSMYLIIDYNI